MSCDPFLDTMLLTRGTPLVARLLTELDRKGCKVDFHCVPCYDNPTRIAYYQEGGKQGKKIMICSNKMGHLHDMETSLAHELIHAYDFCGRKLNRMNPEDAACTEIRAYFHSDCRSSNKSKFKSGWEAGWEDCVKDGATRSLMGGVPSLDYEDASSVVAKMMDKCIGKLF